MEHNFGLPSHITNSIEGPDDAEEAHLQLLGQLVQPSPLQLPHHDHLAQRSSIPSVQPSTPLSVPNIDRSQPTPSTVESQVQKTTAGITTSTPSNPIFSNAFFPPTPLQAPMTPMTPITPSSSDPGIVPQLQNIVSTVNLGCKLDLKKIALHARNAEYNPKRFAAVIMRFIYSRFFKRSFHILNFS